RQIRFTNVREIVEMEPILKAYIYEAIEVEKAGLKVNFKKTTEFMVPEEFQNKLDEIPALKTAFDALTPGRQRAYLLYFSAPKQSKTREARVEKCMQQILNGKGLND
ncbi:MAG: YdeI/OmpD-associated family protein, partial [Nitrosopumilaceae archaeon]|nr:YdeI/OmpD-associated family protein [Nitrosopumilaceae archaeon]